MLWLTPSVSMSEWQLWNWATVVGGHERVSLTNNSNSSACCHECNGHCSNPPILSLFLSSQNRRAMFVFPILLWPPETSLGNHTKFHERFNESQSLPSNFPVQTKTLCSLEPTPLFRSKVAISQFSFLWQNVCQLILQLGLQDFKFLNVCNVPW